MMEHMFEHNLYNGDWGSVPDSMQQMMQNYYGGFKPFLGLSGTLNFINSVLFAILLIAAIRWLWKKGGK